MNRLFALLTLPIGFLGTIASCEQVMSLRGPSASGDTSGDTGLADTAAGGDLDPCDGLDNDGDGQVDEDGVTWYADPDGDGFGDPASTAQSCTQPSGFTSDSSDCAPVDPTVYPGAAERCSEGVDADCDGLAACEDGDCATDPACVEDCWDGDDNDTDGYADGLDDDCWAEHGASIRSRLGGGKLNFDLFTQGYYKASTPYYEGSIQGSATSLTGSASLMSASGTVVCQWTVPQVHFYTSYFSWISSSSATGGHSEALATLSSGCPAALERDVLPPSLSGADVRDGATWREVMLTVDGPTGPWYSGTAELGTYKSRSGTSGQIKRVSATVPALNPTTATWSP